jgi:hypothetical protein
MPLAGSVTGRASGIPAGWQLWVVITPPGAVRPYHPQPGPLTVGPNGIFQGSVTYGIPAASNTEVPRASLGTYVVRLVLVDGLGASEFRDYLASAAARGYPGLATLPRGARILARACIDRS